MSRRGSKRRKPGDKYEVGQAIPIGSFRETEGERSALKPRRMQKLLDDAFAQAPEDADWCDVMHQLARGRHPDLAGVFRRIAAHLPPTKDAGTAFFYWAAAAEFARLGMREPLSEVSAGVCRLDRTSYDADAVAHIQDILLATGCEGDALRIAEHFLPVFREDEELVRCAADDWCNLLFELRVGQHLRAVPPKKALLEQIADKLQDGLETAVHRDVANTAAAVICEVGPLPTWARAHFDLIMGDLHDEANWRAYLGFSATLMAVVREAWHVDPDFAAGGFRGLMELLRTEAPPSSSRKKWRRGPSNFLDYLEPVQLEGRVAHACPEILGINVPKARLLLRACGLLARFANRHGLLAGPDAAACEAELARLDWELGYA